MSTPRFLMDLTLIGLGVASIGHRRKLLAAIAALRAGSISAANPAATAAPITVSEKSTPAAEAERRQLTVMFVEVVGSIALAARLTNCSLRSTASSPKVLGRRISRLPSLRDPTPSSERKTRP
ncbi:hypothetical protein QA641_14290 [Bradyrhizobium sp. CB1650]|uniref:hypothetical protein n=1 Tax=Bradyrhizobium sp. CB1650 TaxID=3039153 RepID=UPI002435CC53|nr:hypothetical protein [Bradyrhizobium sp. CB1650]WGD56917.1 hypothetical protein QA641_14290 [Bradyrhizobium sp. CB1650]